MAIARNIVAYNVPLDDLAGITVLAGADYDLSIEPAESVAGSQDLINAINNDEIIMLGADGTPLTKAESLGAATQTDNDRYAAVTAQDTTPDYLTSKVVAGEGVSITILNPGANEQLEISSNHSISQLNDVVITGPVGDNEVIAWDNGSSKWINQTATEAGITLYSDFTTHTGDGTIHFTEGSIDHTAILNIGTNSHTDIDTHIADGSVHYTKDSINLDDLGDVVINTPADNEVISWDTTTGKFINQTPSEAGLSTATHTHLSTEVMAPYIVGSTYTDVQKQLDFFHSTGVISGGAITDNGDGTINVTSGHGFVRLVEDPSSELYLTDFPSATLGPFIENVIYYIEAYINGGVPTVQEYAATRPSCTTHIHLGMVLREGTTIHFYREAAFQVGDHARLMINRLQDTMPFARVSGASVGETGTRNISVSVGTFWEGLTKFTTPAWDTSVSGTFDYYHRDGSGGWIETSSAQIDNLQYDDGTGTLATLTDTHYGIHWVYVEADNHLSVVFGRGNYATLATAQDAQPFADLPPQLTFHSRLVAKIVIEKNASTFADIESAFVTPFTASPVTDHNDLVNIGVNTHADIDTHIASTTNPHSTSIANLIDTTITSPNDQDLLFYNTTVSKWVNGQISRLSAVSATDTTPGFLGTEIVAGSGIQLNILNPGANEKLEIQNLSSAPNLWATFAATTGSTTANVINDTLTIIGATGLATSITGDTLTIAPANDLAALEGLTGTGIAVRTATDTWAQRTITGTTDQISVTNGAGVAGNPIIALAPNTKIPGTGSLDIPSGTTAERPVAPTTGEMRFNTTIGSYEAWNGSSWLTFANSVVGSGVTEIISGVIPHLSGTTITPQDNTPPLITEGTQFFSQPITTQTLAGRVVIWFSTVVTVSKSNRVATISLFRDSTLIGVTTVGAPSTNGPVTATFIVADTPGATGSHVYSGRIGLSAAATWYIGGWTPSGDYGGAVNTNNQFVLMRLE